MSERDDIEVKAVGPITLDAASQGEVTALVNTLNVVDRDRDVILPGAIKDGTKVKLSAYGHSAVIDGAPPVGKGVLHCEGDGVLFRGKYFMGTTYGRDAFETVKALGDDGEWSVGFVNVKTAEMTEEWKAKGARRLISSLDMIEVSPVLRGANQFTATVSVKEADEERERQEAAAEQARKDAEALETKRLADEAEQKVRVKDAMAEYERVQRTLKRMNVA